MLLFAAAIVFAVVLFAMSLRRPHHDDQPSRRDLCTAAQLRVAKGQDPDDRYVREYCD